GRQFACLPEHVDRHASARIPVAADAQPFRLQQRHELLADGDGAVFVETAVITEAAQKKLQRFRLHEPFPRHVVDHEVREIWLAGDGTKRGEFRRSEARHVARIAVRVLYPVERGFGGRGWQPAWFAEMAGRFGHTTMDASFSRGMTRALSIG